MHFRTLNDSSEIELLREPLIEVVESRFRKILRHLKRDSFRLQRTVTKFGGLSTVASDAARGLVNSVYKVTFEAGGSVPFGDPFIASFCTHSGDQQYERENGLLSQWRGYAANGGYCIVLDTAALAGLLGEEFDRFYWIHLNLDEVLYAFDGTSVADLFPVLLDRFDLVFSRMLEQGDMGPPVEDGFAPFVTAATLLKHQGFKEEREVRIVAMPGSAALRDRVKAEYPAEFTNFPLKQIRTISGARGLRRYITLFDGLKANLPIKRVIVGPSKDQDANHKRARHLLPIAVDVVRSATPFIG